MSRIATTRQNLAFGERLARVRDLAGLNQTQFAESLGLSMRAYANYERGEREAPLAVLRAVYEVYQVDPVWLIGGYEEQPVVGEFTFDVALVAEIAAEIDRRAAKAKRRLKPAARKRAIQVAYTRCQATGKLDPRVLEDLVSVLLAA